MTGNNQSLTNRQTIVFLVWKSLGYPYRIVLSLTIILGGFVMQYIHFDVLPGIILLFTGMLLLLPRGYDNRLNLGKYDPGAEWEEVGRHKLEEFLQFEKKVKRWDRSFFDISNSLGCFGFFILLAAGGFLFVTYISDGNTTLKIIFWDMAVLLVPFWFTGLRKIHTIPSLSLKMKFIVNLLKQMDIPLGGHQVECFFLLSGKEKKIPKDVKFRVNIKDHHEDFLGLYGQVVLNRVQNTPYPYFYVVLVAKKGFGMKKSMKEKKVELLNPRYTRVEHKNQKDVEVMVIRRDTKAASRGYHTKQKQAIQLLQDGINAAEKIAVK